MSVDILLNSGPASVAFQIPVDLPGQDPLSIPAHKISFPCAWNSLSYLFVSLEALPGSAIDYRDVIVIVPFASSDLDSLLLVKNAAAVQIRQLLDS